ncbi:MAG: hypothetical protein Q7R35_03255 [Elusimicrobiota bacterium]|nr:hypothetical protein [Elusimicrobiota bacterium]
MSELTLHAYRVLWLVLIFWAGALLPGIAVASDTGEERLGRGKTSSSFHYFTDVEYAYREVRLKRGGWDSNRANLKDFTVRFGIRSRVPQFILRMIPKADRRTDGHMEYFFSVTAEELRKERRGTNSCGTTTDIMHTGLSPIFGLGFGGIRWGPERAPIRTRFVVRYGKYKRVSYSRRFAGNEYDVQADISVLSWIIEMEWRYRLRYFEPFLAYNIYNFSLDRNLIYPSPSVGTSGNYVDVGRNTHGLAVGTWIKLRPDTTLRLARYFFNQDTYTIQTEMRF